MDFLNRLYYCIRCFISFILLLEHTSSSTFTKPHTAFFSRLHPLLSFLPFLQLLFSLSIVTIATLCPSVSFALCIFYSVMPDSTAKYNSTTWPLHEIRKKQGHGTVAVIVFCILKPKLMKKTGAKNNEAKVEERKERNTKGRGQWQG